MARVVCEPFPIDRLSELRESKKHLRILTALSGFLVLLEERVLHFPNHLCWLTSVFILLMILKFLSIFVQKRFRISLISLISVFRSLRFKRHFRSHLLVNFPVNPIFSSAKNFSGSKVAFGAFR